MVFTKILPALFSVVMAIGVFLFAAGFAGGLFRKTYAPVKDKNNVTIFSIITGKKAASWGKTYLLASMPFLAIAITGFYVSLGFFNSPAYLINLVEAPADNDILYSINRDGRLEVAYGFNENARIIQEKFTHTLKKDGWKITKSDLITLRAMRGDYILDISFIGFQMGDSRIYPTKAILTLTQVQ